jgi:hypothetical protein
MGWDESDQWRVRRVEAETLAIYWSRGDEEDIQPQGTGTQVDVGTQWISLMERAKVETTVAF